MAEAFEVKRLDELEPQAWEQALDAFLEGFGGLFPFAGSQKQKRELFGGSMEQTLAYACLENGRALGVMGLSVKGRRPLSFDRELCRRIYGSVRGELVFRLMTAIYGKDPVKEQGEIYVDFLAAAAVSRGRGVGKALLEHALALPECRVCRLEVLSKNTAARRLYGKLGFQAERERFEFMTWLQGLGNPIDMKKERPGE